MRSGPKARRAQRGTSESKLSQGSDKEALENSRGCCQGLGCRRELGVRGRDSSLWTAVAVPQRHRELDTREGEFHCRLPLN